jgi:KDO2-lipid IV(A) lauroyltransferase
MGRVLRDARVVKRGKCPPLASALHGGRETITRRELSRRTPKPKKTLQWRLECLAHSALEVLAALLPGPWVFHLGEALGALAWHFLPQRRKTVLRNLRIAFAGEKELPEIRRMARETFRRSGANLVSVAHTARFAPEQLGKVIHIENRELLEEALATGRGVVLLLAHMGNWELLSRLVHLFPPGSKAGAFYRPLNNPLLDERVLARRQADGTRMFSKRDPFHQVTGFLREGGIVGILADQRVGKQGEVVPFFGRLTRTSPLPSLLARRAKAEVLALSLVTERPGKWKAVFLPVEKPHSTPHCMAALEKAMKAAPADVFWLQERWKVFVRRLRPFQKWLPPESLPGTKPHRALIWLTEAMNSGGLPDAWLHPDVIYEAAIPAGSRAPEWLQEGTRIHSMPPVLSSSVIRSLDENATLPFDFIITRQAPPALVKAAASEMIPLVSVP